MFINKSRLLALPCCHPIVQWRKNPWQLALWKVCFSLTPLGKEKKKKETHNKHLKAKWTRSSQQNNFTSPAPVRQPTAQTTWLSFLPLPPPGAPTEGHCAQSVVAATQETQGPWEPCRGRMVTGLTPFFLVQAGVSLLILKLSPRENISLFKFFKTTTCTFHMFSILTKEVSFS